MARARDAREWVAHYDEARHGAVALLLIGMRDLKQVNERFGRDAGNSAIRVTAARLRAASHEYASKISLLARLPGREFLLAISCSEDPATIDTITRKLLATLSEAIQRGHEQLYISPRIGLAMAQVDESGIELLSRAQGAVSEAYSRKGRKHAVAAPALDLQTGIANQLDRELRAAMEIACDHHHVPAPICCDRWHANWRGGTCAMASCDVRRGGRRAFVRLC